MSAGDLSATVVPRADQVAPRVTVYLPTRNRADRVGAAIESVLAQSMRDLELIVVDDGSSDSTPQVLREFAGHDARVRLLTNPTPGGAPAARNRAIAEARGEYITGIDDDDMMRPSRLSALLAGYSDDYAFVCSAFDVLGEHGLRTCNAKRAEILLDDLLHGNCVGNQVLTRTARVRAVGGFDPALVASQDYDLWTRLVVRHGSALRIAESSYVVTRDAGPERISASSAAARGARQYALKHDALMSRSQRRSQRLIEIIAAGRHMSMRDLLRCFTRRNAIATLGYFLRSRFPALARVARRLLRRAFP